MKSKTNPEALSMGTKLQGIEQFLSGKRRYYFLKNCFIKKIKLPLSLIHFQIIMTYNKELLNQLKKEIQSVLDQQIVLKAELKLLREKHQQLYVEKQRAEDEVKDLHEQVKTIKLAQAINGSDDQSNRELKNQINRYLREIDKCLHIINRD